MQTLPLAAVPSQTFAVVLGGQQVQCALYLLGTDGAAAMYLDLTSDGETIFTARVARAFSGLPDNTAPFMLVGEHYRGFEGDLLFIDTQATPTNPAQDPQPAGLGTRWQLMYFSVADLQSAGLLEAA